MTDNEIIKALECCSNWESDKSCEECPANTYGFSCANKMAKHYLDLINRQKSEIEELTETLDGETTENMRLKHEIERLEQEIDMAKRVCKELVSYKKALQTAKSEAIKEFAERFKNEIRCEDDCGYHCFDCCYECKDYVPVVDNLVKEMTEANEK